MKCLSLSILLIAMTAGCSIASPMVASSPGPFPATSVFVPIPTAAEPPSTETPPAPTSTPTASVYVPFSVAPWADNVLLRSNPGSLFSKLAILDKGATLLLLGRSPGGEWLLVMTADNRAGWVFAKLIDFRGTDPGPAPFMMPSSVQEITGTVKDEQGQPISGIQFSLIQGVGSNAPRNDAMTDSTGTFFAFMPADAQGEWTVGYTAVACTSNTMDAQCNCTNNSCGKRPYPDSTSISLPLKQGAVMAFIWK